MYFWKSAHFPTEIMLKFTHFLADIRTFKPFFSRNLHLFYNFPEGFSTIALLAVLLRQPAKMLRYVRVPMYDRGQIFAGELCAQAAKLYLVLLCAGMYPALARASPFRHISVSLNTALALTLQPFPTSLAAFPAGSNF